MSDLITVPGSVLAALGGLTEDDPPVLYLRWAGVDGYQPCAFHPAGTKGERHAWRATDDRRLILPASAPALLRVLARHLGMTLEPGEVPTLRRIILYERSVVGVEDWARWHSNVLCSMPTLAAVLAHVAQDGE